MRATRTEKPSPDSIIFQRKLYPHDLQLVEEIAPLKLRSTDDSRPDLVLLKIQPNEKKPTLLVSITSAQEKDPEWFRIESDVQEISAIIKVFFVDHDMALWVPNVLSVAEALEVKARDIRALVNWASWHSAS